MLGGVKRQTVYEMLKDGRLRGKKLAGRGWRKGGVLWVIDESSIHRDMYKKRGPRPREAGGDLWWGPYHKVIYSLTYWELHGGLGATVEDLVIAKVDAERDGTLAKLLEK